MLKLLVYILFLTAKTTTIEQLDTTIDPLEKRKFILELQHKPQSNDIYKSQQEILEILKVFKNSLEKIKKHLNDGHVISNMNNINKNNKRKTDHLHTEIIHLDTNLDNIAKIAFERNEYYSKMYFAKSSNPFTDMFPDSCNSNTTFTLYGNLSYLQVYFEYSNTAYPNDKKNKLNIDMKSIMQNPDILVLFKEL